MYSSLKQIEIFSCRDECTCKESNLKDLDSSVEKELFLKVCSKVSKLNSKIHDDFNISCNDFVFFVCESEIIKFRDIIKYNEW